MNSNNDGRKDPGLALSDFVGHPLYQPLMDAIRQAMFGKGERHGGATVPFRDQPIFHYGKMHGRGFLTGQAAKKLEEAADRLHGQAFVEEMLGAIVYAGAAIIQERERMFAERIKAKVVGAHAVDAAAAGVMGAMGAVAGLAAKHDAAYAQGDQNQIQAQGHDGPGGLIRREVVDQARAIHAERQRVPSSEEVAAKEAALGRYADGRTVAEQEQRSKWADRHDAARANAGL